MDFGEEKGLTPIDAVIQHGNAPDASSAARWLCERLGKKPPGPWLAETGERRKKRERTTATLHQLC